MRSTGRSAPHSEDATTSRSSARARASGESDAASRPSWSGPEYTSRTGRVGSSRTTVLRATSCAFVGRTCSRRNASGAALVTSSASRISRRSGVSAGNESAARSTGGPASGGGRFDSEGGATISTTPC